MDKVSVLNKAIEYVRSLEQRVKDLEIENKKRKIESEGCLKVSKSNMVGYDFSWTSHACYDGDEATKKCSKVEARVAGKDVLIRVTFEMQRNIVQNVMAKLEAHNLFVLCSNVLPLGISQVW
ncbi:transcription factor bHLH18-like [Vigna umbellata]|uniref:transcription factor bHLH18-like n=1 Tax=Vigna umbellata TaxID=87088 RepID=UPI001F5EA4DA|nr:transcription factor bHLH18-like [Vigna umbellata]